MFSILKTKNIEGVNRIYEKKSNGMCHKKYGEKLPLNVMNRLEYEWGIISKYHLENDLLTLAEIMKKWRNLGYFIHGDGCLKESLIMYLLGIVDANLMCLNKLFELDLQKRQFEIIVSQEIQDKFDEDLKDKGVISLLNI